MPGLGLEIGTGDTLVVAIIGFKRISEASLMPLIRISEDFAGATTADVCRKHGICSATFYKWKAKYGGLEVSDAKRLKALEDENVKRAIFLIVDRGPAHIAKKTRAFVDSQHGRLRLFFLPPYSPDRNPDELVWKHLKTDTVGRMTITDKADFKAKVRASMRQLQNDPEKIRSFYQKPSLKYAA
jgi:hypothetical protein